MWHWKWNEEDVFYYLDFTPKGAFTRINNGEKGGARMGKM